MTSNDYSRKLSYNMDIVIPVNLHYSEILLSQFIFCLFSISSVSCSFGISNLYGTSTSNMRFVCVSPFTTRKSCIVILFIYIHNNVYHITFQLLYFVVVYSYWIHMDSCHTFQILFKLFSQDYLLYHALPPYPCRPVPLHGMI